MNVEESLQTTCHNCQKPFSFLQRRIGETWPCIHCGKDVLLRAPSHQTTQSPSTRVKKNKKGVGSATRREEVACLPLLQAATKDLYRQNAFRITGLPVDATVRDISRHADKLKILAELGDNGVLPQSPFALRPQPGLDQIRDATQRLKDPEARIIDEFFWFWPEEFGCSHADRALKFLAQGNLNQALEIWTGNHATQTGGVIARHNLAVFWHVAALDAEFISLNSEPGAVRTVEIGSSWRKAIEYWESILVEDPFWELVTTRIRQMADARLTTGFARRMRAVLPDAFDKINADLALAYAESGRQQEARTHVELMHQSDQGFDNFKKAALLALSPSLTRLREYIARAKRDADDTPSNADTAARTLLGQSRPILATVSLFFEEESPIDVSDDVAEAVVKCMVAYQKKTGNDKVFVELLNLTLPLAQSQEVRDRIEKNLSIGRANIHHQQLKPILERLDEIEESTEPPSWKLSALQAEILPQMEALIRREGETAEVVQQLGDRIAGSLRDISIDAHNQHRDTHTAIQAISSASIFARDPKLKLRLKEDEAKLVEIQKRQESQKLHLVIRDDEIEVNNQFFRLNNQTFYLKDITAVRYGISTGESWGLTKKIFLVEVAATDSRVAEIDCKRFFRSAEQALRDFSAIVGALNYFAVPIIAQRIAREVLAGKEFPLGDYRPFIKLSSRGVRFIGYAHNDYADGSAEWVEKETLLLPYPDVQIQLNSGKLSIGSKLTKKEHGQVPINSIWNAAITEEVVAAIIALQE